VNAAQYRAELRLKPPRKNASPEYHFTVDVKRLLEVRLPSGLLWTHFPAGELRDERTAAKLKHMGTQPGWPDFIVVLPGSRMSGLELKVGRGRLGPHQTAFKDALEALGGDYAVCRSLDDVQAVLSAWLAPHGLKLKGTPA